MTRVLLIRHSQSEWNAAGRWQGRADPPLTDVGRQQARMAAASVPDHDLLAASTLQRAVQTAEEIASHFGRDDLVLDERLVERDVGAFSGLTRAQIDERFPGYLEQGLRPDGWEPEAVVVGRVRAAVHGLADAAPGGVVVAVTHGGVIYTFERMFDLPHERIANLGGRWLHVDDGEVRLGQRVHLLDPADEVIPGQL